MGQRHQIYVKVPKIENGKGNPNNRPATVIGIHNQWLYGAKALRMLSLLLTCIKNCEGNIKYFPLFFSSLSQAVHTLDTVYSVDHERGFVTGNSPLIDDEKNCNPGEETLDPTRGDNNNGITIVDLSMLDTDKDYTAEEIAAKIKYCFMSIEGLECLAENQEKNYENFQPLSGEQYLKLHYPDFEKYLCKDKDKEKLMKSLDIKPGQIEHARFCESLVKELSQYKVLTLAEVKKIFPKCEKIKKAK